MTSCGRDRVWEENKHLLRVSLFVLSVEPCSWFVYWVNARDLLCQGAVLAGELEGQLLAMGQ